MRLSRSNEVENEANEVENEVQNEVQNEVNKVFYLANEVFWTWWIALGGPLPLEVDERGPNEVVTKSFILYERVYINVIYFDRITDPSLIEGKGVNKECSVETSFLLLLLKHMSYLTSLITSTPSGFSQQLKILPSLLPDFFD